METEYMSYGVDWILEKIENPHMIVNKSMETRMRVVTDQLLLDMITDTDMNQIKKKVALLFIDKTKLKLTKLANDRGTDYEVITKFRNKIGKLKLRLLFKKVKEDHELNYDMMWR